MPDSLFNKALACNFIKKESLAKVFSYGFCEFIKDTLFSEHLQATALEIKQRRNYGPVSVKETFCEQLKTNPWTQDKNWTYKGPVSVKETFCK